MKKLSTVLVLALTALLPLACGHDAEHGGKSSDRHRVAVIPKGMTHVFWKSVERGAKEAGHRFGLDVIWKGPLKESARAEQIQLVQQFVTDAVDGIVLAPLDFRALVAPVRAAKAKKIPVVIIDSALDGKPGTDFASFVATDNKKGGVLAGEKLAELLHEQGKVVMLRYAVGSSSTDNREKGFLESVSSYKRLQQISINRYAGATAGEAKTQALNMMDKLREADGIFTPNESSTLGMLLALRQEGLAGKKRFVGFDASPPLVKALEKGEIDALVVQNPHKMGFESVRVLRDVLDGKPVQESIDTGVVVVTKENMRQADIAPLLK